MNRIFLGSLCSGRTVSVKVPFFWRTVNCGSESKVAFSEHPVRMERGTGTCVLVQTVLWIHVGSVMLLFSKLSLSCGPVSQMMMKISNIPPCHGGEAHGILRRSVNEALQAYVDDCPPCQRLAKALVVSSH